MQVRMTANVKRNSDGKRLNAGNVYTLPEHIARDLIFKGFAVCVDAPVEKPASKKKK